MIQRVLAGKPGAQAGLEAGMRIVEVNGKCMIDNTHSEVIAAIAAGLKVSPILRLMVLPETSECEATHAVPEHHPDAVPDHSNLRAQVPCDKYGFMLADTRSETQSPQQRDSVPDLSSDEANAQQPDDAARSESNVVEEATSPRLTSPPPLIDTGVDHPGEQVSVDISASLARQQDNNLGQWLALFKASNSGERHAVWHLLHNDLFALSPAKRQSKLAHSATSLSSMSTLGSDTTQDTLAAETAAQPHQPSDTTESNEDEQNFDAMQLTQFKPLKPAHFIVCAFLRCICMLLCIFPSFPGTL
jgi:hypothetical protein